MDRGELKESIAMVGDDRRWVGVANLLGKLFSLAVLLLGKFVPGLLLVVNRGAWLGRDAFSFGRGVFSLGPIFTFGCP